MELLIDMKPEDYPDVYPTKTVLGQFHQHKSHPVRLFQHSVGGYYLDDRVRASKGKYYRLIDESDLRGKRQKI